jgi:hypothetical protein
MAAIANIVRYGSAASMMILRASASRGRYGPRPHIHIDRLRLCFLALRDPVQIDQRLVRSAHTAACTSSGRLFVSPNVSYQDFGG